VTSVLQDWVADLPLRAQGTLLTGVRGCDLVPKYPLDSIERRLVGAVRAAFMNPADPREVDAEPGCFFLSAPPPLDEIKPSSFGHYPWHWLSHLVHVIEVLGYTHPDPDSRYAWHLIYRKFVHSFHLNPELHSQWLKRMSEDRVAAGTIVS